MKQHFLNTVFLLLGASSALSAVAYDVHVGDGYYNLHKSDQTATLTYLYHYNTSNAAAYVGDVVIPETFEHEGVVYSVTSVDPRTFYACKDLTTLELPSTITEIGNNAFYSCSGLVSVTLPAKLSALDYSAFQGCTALEEIALPPTLLALSSAVFSGCTRLTSVKFPPALSTIGNSAFYGCSSLAAIDFPRNLVTISPRAFSLCTSLESLVFPDALRQIQTSAFQGCTQLKRVEFGKSLEVLDVNCFADCTQLSDVYCNSAQPPADVYTSDFSGTPFLRLHVPGEAVESYYKQANWSKFQQILPHQCSTPEFRLSGDEFVFTTTTNLNYAKDVNESYTYSIEVSDLAAGVVASEEMATFGDLQLTYDVRVKATAAGCEDSHELTAQLCWIGSEILFDGEESGTLTPIAPSVSSRPVLVTCRNGEITVSGLVAGEPVVLYDLNGRQLAAAVASGSEVSLMAAGGPVLVVKVGNSSFKIRVN